MSKVAVVYWSSTGNTEAMANAVADGIREKGGEAVLHTCEDFDGSKVAEYDAIAFGCPAMGDEVLEDTEFEPMFDGCKDALKGKNIALFGSYGWGDGEWMRNWVARMEEAGAQVYGGEDAICMNEPDSEAEEITGWCTIAEDKKATHTARAKEHVIIQILFFMLKITPSHKLFFLEQTLHP